MIAIKKIGRTCKLKTLKVKEKITAHQENTEAVREMRTQIPILAKELEIKKKQHEQIPQQVTENIQNKYKKEQEKKTGFSQQLKASNFTSSTPILLSDSLNIYHVSSLRGNQKEGLLDWRTTKTNLDNVDIKNLIFQPSAKVSNYQPQPESEQKINIPKTFKAIEQ